MMRLRCLVVFVVLAFSVIPLSGSAWATCDQQDLKGTWDAEVWAGDDSGTQCWDQCTLTIDPNGFVEPGGTYRDFLGKSSEVTGGQLIINADCVIEGTIETSNHTVYVERGAIAGDRLFLGVPE